MTRWLTVSRAGKRLHLRFRGVGGFILSADGREVEGTPARGADPTVFRRTLVDQVLPRALHLRGIPVLHASAVATRRGAVVFLGESGTGKSTLALRHVLRGGALLADDGVRLEVRGDRVLAHPSHPLLRVRRDVLATLPRRLREGAVREAGKWTLPPVRFARGLVKVRRIVLLGGSGPVGPREALLALLDGTFRADPWDLAAFARDIGFLASVLERVPVHRHGVRN